eukprot:m.103840 g.103840  ORF g.103840 m.103840 type:complete len:54 (-) comp10498_c0_seq1:8-169(-)
MSSGGGLRLYTRRDGAACTTGVIAVCQREDTPMLATRRAIMMSIETFCRAQDP